MIDVETFKTVKDDLFLRSTRIPNFLDTSSRIDYTIWGNFRAITDIILQMVATKTFNDKVIYMKALEASEHFDKIVQLCDSDRLLLLCDMILKFIDRCIKTTEINELYESTSNLVKFNDKFYISKI